MANITLTHNMAQGAAKLAAKGATLDAVVLVKGRTRFCHLAGCDETGANVTLRTMIGGEAVYADLAVGRVQVSQAVAKQCLAAFEAGMAASGEPAGLRIGRLARETPAQLNARLWIEYQAQAGRRA